MHHSYSNAGAGLAAYVLEQQTGMKFEDFVQKEIFDPLDLKSATFFQTPRIKRARPKGFKKDGFTEIPYWHVFSRPFGAINISTEDMGKFLKCLMGLMGHDDGKPLLNDTDLKRLRTPHSTLAAKNGLHYGYALGLYGQYYKHHIFYGHNGDADGFLASLAFLPEEKRGFVVMINAVRAVAPRAGASRS